MRGKQATQRKIAPDSTYGSVVVAKFIHHVMRGGKKSLAERLVYQTFDIIADRTKRKPMDVFDEAIRNVSPSVAVKSRRIGGSNYQIPVEVRGDRKVTLAMRWLLEAARAKHGKSMPERLADEIIAATQKQGDAWKKKEDVHRMAEANRAFAHFA